MLAQEKHQIHCVSHWTKTESQHLSHKEPLCLCSEANSGSRQARNNQRYWKQQGTAQSRACQAGLGFPAPQSWVRCLEMSSGIKTHKPPTCSIKLLPGAFPSDTRAARIHWLSSPTTQLKHSIAQLHVIKTEHELYTCNLLFHV